MDELNRRSFVQAGLIGGTTLFTSCKALEQIIEASAHAAMQAGEISEQEANSIIRSTRAVARSFEDFSAEQEYYIGRTVAAQIFSRYNLYNDPQRNNYLNLVGLSIARNSPVPETFGGYHFIILDAADINAFAAPGGFIFVTLGMLRCCPHEDALAAVLAHEIAHVQLKHGLQAIKKSRVTEAITILAAEAARNSSDEDISALVTNFEGSISDITTTMVNNGYSRSFERDADKLAVKLMEKAAYSPRGMDDMLEIMDKKLKPGGSDFFKTHPSPGERRRELSVQLKNPPAISPLRQHRLRLQLGII